MGKIARFFITNGKRTPLHKEVARIVEARRAAYRTLKAFMDKHGMEAMYGDKPSAYLFDPKYIDGKGARYTYDEKKWTKVKRPRGQWFLRPRRNTPEGKALAEEVKALPDCPAVEDAISIVPGLGRFPMIFTDSRAFYPFIKFFDLKSGVAVIEVPSWEGKTKVADHKQAQQWAPPPWLREVKEWEALKAIDEAGQ